MGWFLIGSGKKTKRGKAKRKASEPRKWDTQRMLRAVQITGYTLGAIALALGWYFGEDALQRYIAGNRTKTPRVVMRDVPVWMSDRVVHDLGLIVTNSVDGDPFDQAALQRAVADLAANAWVERVQRISRQPGGHIEVVATYREPAAVVEQRDPITQAVTGYLLVDRDAVRLPAIYERAHLEQIHLPLMCGVHHAAPEPGAVWPGGDIKAGIALARVVNAQPWRNQVQAIDVTNYGARRYVGEAQLKLLTKLDDDDDPRNNTGVAWGRAPGDEQFYEPDTATKLANLAQVLRRFNTIDADGQIVALYPDVVQIHALAETAHYTVAR